MGYFALSTVAVLLALICVSRATTVCDTQNLNSNNYAYVRTTVPGASRVTSITLLNQRSNSPCVPDVSFGKNGPDVFVDRGCCGSFRICYEAVVTVVCDTQNLNSNDYAYVRTTVPGASRVTSITLLNRSSNSPCVPDVSFGKYGPDVFVDRGCCGSFRICYEAGVTRAVDCNSNNYRESRCNARGNIRYISLRQARSNSPCVEGFSYSHEGSYIIVNKGCRATFLVGW